MEVGHTRSTSFAVMSAEKPWSHSWTMEIRLRSPKARKMFDLRAHKSSWGKGKRVVCGARIDYPFGRPTKIPLEVEDLLVHGVVGPRKQLVQP